jgi:hypothetical protein
MRALRKRHSRQEGEPVNPVEATCTRNAALSRRDSAAARERAYDWRKARHGQHSRAAHVPAFLV